MRVSPKRLARKLKVYGVPHTWEKDADSRLIDPFDGRSDFQGVVLHHTASKGNSLNYIMHGNPYAPVRACHFLVDRDGLVHVVSAVGAYHAGRGGPVRFPSGLDNFVPSDQGNRFLYGIEVESLGGTRRIDGSKEGMTVEQVVSTALLCAALLNAMKRGPGSKPVSRVIRHSDWTPRKIDVRQDLDWWHQVIGIARRNKGNVSAAKRLIRRFVAENPRGVIR